MPRATVLLACRAADEQRLRAALGGDVDVLASSHRPEVVMAAAQRSRPDVLVVALPARDGAIALIADVMCTTPVPVLALCHAGDEEAGVAALAEGAVEALPLDIAPGLLRERLAVLRGVTVVRRRKAAGAASVRPRPGAMTVVAVAASTGGPPALARLLATLAGLPAPVLVVQHLHADFVSGLVSWLGADSPLPVGLATDGQQLRAGVVYLAPSGAHLKVAENATVILDPEPPQLHRPSADELFASVARNCGSQSVGVILTGMGEDGAAGLRQMRDAGAVTLGQDEATCAVFGMPKAAWERGAVQRLLPLELLGGAVAAAVREGARP